jgi:hypothetical protein
MISVNDQMNKLFYIITSLLFLNAAKLTGQPYDPFITILKDKFSKYTSVIPYEDIFIHTDRDTYIAGEYSWFSAYLFDRKTLTLSAGSSFVYIELLDPENKSVVQTRINLKDGTGSGGIMLPDTLGSGQYTLKGYTNLMKNCLPAACFRKSITLYNPFNSKPFKIALTKNFPSRSEYMIMLFPEGGRLLNGFINKVGVRAYDKMGKGLCYKGYLSDGFDKKLINVTTDSSGIGAFEFLADAEKNYALVSEDGKTRIMMPPVSKTGLSLKVKSPLTDSLKMTVNAANVPDNGTNFFYLVIHSHGSILKGDRINFTKNSLDISLDRKILQPGINQVIVFNATGNPECERLINNSCQVQNLLRINTGETAKKREKKGIQIAIDTKMLPPVLPASLSLSVSAIAGPEASNDINDYLITGDEFSSLDFNEIIDHCIFRKSEGTVDNYLLSVRSNWISWTDVIAGSLPVIKYQAETRKKFLSGVYKSSNKSKLPGNNTLFLSVPGKIPLFKYSITDTENRFAFVLRENEYADEYIIQSAESDNSAFIQMESQFSEVHPETNSFTDTTRKNIPAELEKWSINYQIQKIYGISEIGDTIKAADKGNKAVRFYGKPDQELVMKDYISLPTMQEVFFELIPGVSVKTKKAKSGFFVQDQVNLNYLDSPAVMLVDGVIIDDPGLILNLDPEIVEKIDIIKGEYIVGDIIFTGIISVITKSGDLSNISLPKNAIRIRENFYDKTRSYMPPDLPLKNSSPDRIPDFRNTLFWKSDLKPDNSGMVNIDIITSDFTSSYQIDLQGVINGKPVSVRKSFKVE